MDATPALWMAFFVALFIATFDNKEFPEYLKMLGAKGAASHLGRWLTVLIFSLHNTPHTPRTTPQAGVSSNLASASGGEE